MAKQGKEVPNPFSILHVGPRVILVDDRTGHWEDVARRPKLNDGREWVMMPDGECKFIRPEEAKRG